MPRDLTPFPLALAMEALTGGTPGARSITMAEGQWDGILQGAYEHGFILLELDSQERPVRAYRKTSPSRERPR